MNYTLLAKIFTPFKLAVLFILYVFVFDPAYDSWVGAAPQRDLAWQVQNWWNSYDKKDWPIEAGGISFRFRKAWELDSGEREDFIVSMSGLISSSTSSISILSQGDGLDKEILSLMATDCPECVSIQAAGKKIKVLFNSTVMFTYEIVWRVNTKEPLGIAGGGTDTSGSKSAMYMFWHDKNIWTITLESPKRSVNSLKSELYDIILSMEFS